MFHSNTQRLIEDWRARRGDRLAPARTDISPAEFKEILPQLFVLGCEEDGPETFRLAGGLLVDLHDRDLRGVSFLSLWPYPDRTLVAETLEDARRSGAPVVLEASGWTPDGYEAKLEIVLAPLMGASGRVERILGLYQPTSSVRRLMGQPIQEMTLREIKSAGQPGRPAPRVQLRLVALDGARLPEV
jgi:hypothetical protein